MHSHFWKSMTRTATLKPTTKSPEISNSLQMNLPLSAQMQEGWKKKEKKRKKGDCNVHTFVSSVLGSGKFRNFSVSLFQLAAFPRSEWITNFSCILITQIVSRRHLKIIYITNALLIYRHKTYPSIVLSTLWLFTSRKRWNLCKKSALEYV